MSGVIDQLIVLLSLDPTPFKAGSKDAGAAFNKTKEDAARAAKEMEAKGKVAAQFFSQIRNQVIALAATFTAGAGLKSFITETTATDAAVGRTARNIGVATETLTAWQGVAERAGGTASGVAGSMQGLSQQFQQLALTGQSSVVPYFRAVGVALADETGKVRPMGDVFLDLADKFSKMDPARAQALGRGMGIDEGTINVLMRGRAAIADLLAEQQKLGAANKADADAAAARQAQFNALGQASADLGRKLLTALTPALMTIVKGLTALAEWFAVHPNVFGVFVGAATVAATLLGAALSILSLKGFLGLVAAMFKVPAAAAAAGTAMEGAAAASAAASASVGTGLLGLLGSLAKGAALVAAAGAVGYAIGTAIYKTFIENTPLSDWIGKKMAQIAAFFGNSDAQEALDAEQRGKRAGNRAQGRVSDGSRAPGSVPAPRGSPAVSAAGREGAESDIQRLMQMGWSRAQATGIAANVQRESAGNEQAVGDNGSAFGLAQWHPDRQREFARQFGKDIRNSTHDEQLQFINYELRQGREREAGNALLRTNDAGEAAGVISRRYERPGDAAGEAAKRAQLAVSLYNAPRPDPALQGGAGTAVAASGATNNVSSNTSHAETHIGEINVTLPNATDAPSVAQGLSSAMKKNFSLAAQANTGLVS